MVHRIHQVVRGGGSSPNTNVMDYNHGDSTGFHHYNFGNLNTDGNSKTGFSNGHGGL